MHEVSVMAGIVEAVLKHLENYDVEKVEEVHLTIGELTNLGADQMVFAYEIVTRGTALEGSQLVIEPEAIAVSCRSCGYQGEVDYVENEEFHNSIPVLSCPRCQGSVDVVSGKSCTVRSMRVVER
ncbi:MAG: hydrogenase maturation nickel metallochaperone HypA [Candidatus Methanomethylophilaceae archaeon]|nr:hydrogenase maturation nickel metallochaperone HypA [Candidatus Methanomethylophilaceae archaeon]